MTQDLSQLGAVAIIFLFAVKEFFAYLKTKKNGNGNETFQAILTELQLMNDNHLHSLKDAIEKGNERLVDVIHGDNVKIIEALGEIRGRLSK